MKSMKSKTATAFAALAMALPLAAYATPNDQATELFENAKKSFEEQRQDLKTVDQVQTELAQAEALATDTELKYQIKILISRAYFWQGTNVPGNEENNPAKLPVFEKGYNKAREAYTLSGDYADAYYYYAINLSRWGLAKGKLSALGRLTELKNHLNLAMQRPTYYTGEDGTTIDFWGPNRVYGRMYFALPGIVGGDMALSKQYLERAAKEAPTHILNIVYLAETLADSRSTRSQAKLMLRDAIERYDANPAAFCPERIQETSLEIRLARELYGKL